ncbi:MAG: hypothetical protein HYZ54_06025 [Ignavibacteriae bacterium]|nr:hypothetical protein [Ignavibacteriota bacterium]
MTIQTKYLDKLKHDQTFVHIIIDKYEESHYGFIIDFNNELLSIERFNSDFNYDGFVVVKRESISKIRWGGNDIISTSILIDESKRSKNLHNVDITSIATALRSMHDSFGHITVFMQDIDINQFYVGQIHEMDNETLVINEFGTKGTLDRNFSLLDVEEITRVDAGGQYENNLTRLFFGKRDNRT